MSDTVEVTVEVPENDDVTSETPTVVVVEDSSDSGNDAVDAVVLETEIDHEGRLTAIELQLAAIAGSIEQLAQRDAQHEFHEEVLEEQLEQVAQVAAEAAEEAQAPAEADDEPNREHFFFRPWGRK